MRCLDTFCGAGGAGYGYHLAGFDVVGVDVNPQKNYPFEFHQADAIEYILEHGHEFDLIHASPPCQAYSAMQNMHKNSESHPDLIGATRDALLKVGKPYVIENVEGAPLRIDLMLCGTMFGLPLRWHRIFESSKPMPILTPTCSHVNLYDRYHGGEMARGEREKLSKVMNVDWFMTRTEVRNAIPPAYTEFIGKAIMEVTSESNRN